MSAGCSYCYRTAWWMCKKCGYIMCDTCDVLHKCSVVSLQGYPIIINDYTPLEVTMLDNLNATNKDIGY